MLCGFSERQLYSSLLLLPYFCLQNVNSLMLIVNVRLYARRVSRIYDKLFFSDTLLFLVEASRLGAISGNQSIVSSIAVSDVCIL